MVVFRGIGFQVTKQMSFNVSRVLLFKIVGKLPAPGKSIEAELLFI